MYDKNNLIKIGKYFISTMPDYEDSIWIEEEGVDGGQFRKNKFEPFLKEFYNNNF